MSDINLDLFYFFNTSIKNPIFDFIMPRITDFGGFEALIIIILAIFFYSFIRKHNTLKKISFLALISLLFSDLIVYVLKLFINEPRPFITLDNVNLLIDIEGSYSFPSGHSSSTFAVVLIFLFNIKDLTKKYYKIASVFLIIFALIIPISRMYVGVHYPIDVFSGAIIGCIGAYIINRCKNKILSIFKN